MKYNGYWINLVKTLLTIPAYFEQFCSLKYFNNFLEKIYIVKSLNIEEDLPKLIPKVWWPDAGQFCTQEDKLEMEKGKNFLNFVLTEHEKNMTFITKLFIENNKPIQRVIPGLEKGCTPRRLYLQWARNLIDKNKFLGTEVFFFDSIFQIFIIILIYFIIFFSPFLIASNFLIIVCAFFSFFQPFCFD